MEVRAGGIGSRPCARLWSGWLRLPCWCWLLVRRAPTSECSGAELRAVFGSVGTVDAFTGMLAERHVPGTEFGELQLAIFKRQFEALRDGDRFFHLADPELAAIERAYGISARRTLGQVIQDNTGIETRTDVFRLAGAPVSAGDGVGATVPSVLSLSIGASTGFGAFTPGVARDYVASTTATVTSTAGDAALATRRGLLAVRLARSGRQ